MRHRAYWLALLAPVLAFPAAGAVPAASPDIVPPAGIDTIPEGPIDVVGFGTDQTDRMTVAVNIEGKGPYPFIVDTGSQRTVISKELASSLRLGKGPTAEVHSTSGKANVQTFIIPSLELNARSVKGIEAPAFEQSNLGAAGILGIDSLSSQRVVLDFKAETMTVRPSTVRVEQWDGETIVVKAKSRFGQLVLVDASAGGEKIWVIIDTGSQVSVGNNALRRKLMGKKSRRPLTPIELISVTGGRTSADYTTVETIRIGGIRIQNMPIAFADVYPFRKLGLTARPALLLGMDALRLFDRVSVDFANKKVRFLSPDGASRSQQTQTALAD
jgi:predicted aspartyl protease